MTERDAQDKGFVGVFDSGVGGLTVLGCLVAELPHERFVFFGDSAHAPYGDKTPEEVLSLSQSIATSLVEEGAKALVIACNTATSVAVQTLRAAHPSIPVIGVEPALKPATLALRHRLILVMATAATLRLGKFQRLEDRWGADSEVIEVPCVGLADLIEKGNPASPAILELLERYLGPWRGKVDSVVLGCTHYPLVRDQIREVMGDVPLYDGVWSRRGFSPRIPRQEAWSFARATTPQRSWLSTGGFSSWHDASVTQLPESTPTSPQQNLVLYRFL